MSDILNRKESSVCDSKPANSRSTAVTPLSKKIVLFWLPLLILSCVESKKDDKRFNSSVPSTQNSATEITTDPSEALGIRSNDLDISIEPISDQIMLEDGEAPAIAIQVATVEERAACAEKLVINSSNPYLLAPSGFYLDGSLPDCTLHLLPSPEQHGSSVVSISYEFKGQKAIQSFLLNVDAVDDLPSLSAIPNQEALAGQRLGPLKLKVSDSDSAIGCQSIVKSTSNALLIPSRYITIEENGRDCLVYIDTEESSAGTVEISLSIADTSANTHRQGDPRVTFLVKTVLASPPLLANLPRQDFMATVGIANLIFSNTGAAAVNCTVSPQLPQGLHLDTVNGTCQISGTPTSASTAQSYSITAYGRDGSQDQSALIVAVFPRHAPQLMNPSPMVFAAFVNISGFTFTNQGAAATSCSSNPTLPNGLILDSYLNSCRISGTPTIPQPPADYLITATSVLGVSANTMVSIAVNAPAPPILADVSADQSLVLGQPFGPLLIDNSGASVLECRTAPALPLGITIIPSTNSCAISGTPLKLQGPQDYIVTATANDGSEDSATIRIIVELVCPSGWTKVPSYQDDYYNVEEFCVMKFEAKNVNSVATSQPGLTPWTSIKRGISPQETNSAWNKCWSLGPGYNLISNAQWQSIAINIETAQSSPGVYLNWKNHSATSPNFLNGGHCDQSPYETIAVDDENDPCSNTGNPNCNNYSHSEFRQKRTHTLSNGQVIWDLAGNAWEYVRDNSAFAYGSDSYFYAVDDNYGAECQNPDVCLIGRAKKVFGPVGNYQAFTASPRAGLGYGWLGNDDLDYYALRRGGYWYNGGYSGIFAVFTGSSGASGSSIGFRCVFGSVSP